MNLGNGVWAVYFDTGTSGNSVQGNTIKNNPSGGVKDNGKNKKFDPNSISDNGFGIDDGTQAGAPVLASAVVSGNTLTVTGTLSSTPNTTFGLVFFGGTDLDPSGSAEGQQWLGTAYVTTDANGNASFQIALNSIYGNYVTATATDMDSDGGTSDFSNTVTVSDESQSATVGGNVWDDTNIDGLPDDGEGGVADVNVQLFTSLGALVASTTTDASGNYLFTNVTPGDYYLQFAAPSGFLFTAPYQGDDTIASHADLTTGDTEQFTLLAGEVDPYINAGLMPTSSQPGTSTSITSDENASSYGDPLTFTATITQTDSIPLLGGTVTFKDGDNVLGTADLTPVSGGYQAVFSTSALSIGDHTITALYNGDGFHTGSSASLTQTVQQGISLTSVSSSNNPALPGQPVTFTATVDTFGAMPTGTVTFEDGTTVLGTATLDANGNATFITSSLTAGSHAITAAYGGDDNFTGSSGSLTQVVSQENDSDMSLSSSDPNNATLGQAITFTATVNGSSGLPTGSVTFMDGDTVLGTTTLDGNGNATLTTSSLLLGSQTITAIYSGDATYGSNDAFLTQTVNYAASSVSLTSDANPAAPGQPVTFTGTVRGSSGMPTGSVTFMDDTTVLATVPLDSNGNATYTTSSLADGSHDITVLYGGDNSYASSAASLTQFVGSSFTVSGTYSGSTTSGAISGYNFGGTISGTLSGNTFSESFSGGPFDGTSFSYTINNNTYGGPFSGTISYLGFGFALSGTQSGTISGSTFSGVFSGTYSNSEFGNGTFAGTSSGTISGSGSTSTSPSISLSSSANADTANQAVTFTAMVSGMNGMPTGSVTFFDGDTVLGTAPLDANGNATFTTSALALGSQAITAIYSGDNTYAPNTATLTQQMVQAATTTSLTSSANPSPSGQEVTFTVTVAAVDPNAGTPTGTVNIYDGTTFLGTATLSVVNGQVQATFTATALALGKHQIIAIYSGDSTFADSGASLEQTISS